MRFELYQDDRENWLWRLRDEEGRIIAMAAGPSPNKKHVYAIVDRILELTKADIVDVRE